MKHLCCSIILLVSILTSCREETDPQSPCGVNNPIKDLSWFQVHIQEWESTSWREHAYITQASYGFETVFLFRNCCPNCGTVIFVYNCSGEKIGSLGSEINSDSIKDEKVIWKSADSTCTV